MSFELFVAGRYLRAKRKGLFAMVTTSIGVAGVTIGVAALITTLSVMNGFQSDIQKKVVGAQAHLSVLGDLSPPGLRRLEEVLARQPEIRASAPFALGQAILTYQGRSTGILLRGLDPEREFQVNELARSIRQGSWDPLRKPGARSPGIVLGEELAKGLGVWPGEEVVLVSPQGVATPLGLMPKMRKFRVAGLLRTGYYEYDNATGYASLSEAASFFGIQAGASGMQARLARLEDAERVARRLQAELGYAYTVRSFRQMNQTLFAALKLEKIVMFLILTLIVLVASFNIASNLILLSTEKLRDIGLLKAMGATPGQIRRIFLWEGALIGACGAGLGAALGLLLCELIERYPLELPGDIYYLTRVPVHVDATDVLIVACCAFLLTLAATLYPAARAARVNPADAIRYG